MRDNTLHQLRNIWEITVVQLSDNPQWACLDNLVQQTKSTLELEADVVPVFFLHMERDRLADGLNKDRPCTECHATIDCWEPFLRLRSFSMSPALACHSTFCYCKIAKWDCSPFITIQMNSEYRVPKPDIQYAQTVNMPTLIIDTFGSGALTGNPDLQLDFCKASF